MQVKTGLWNSSLAISFLFLLSPLTTIAQETLIGDVSDGSRAVPVHLIKLYDEHGSVIRPNETPLLPFSTRETCGQCHDYQQISAGLHFNAGDSATPSGRRGEPWVLADPVTATQIPISQRGWPGTYSPEQLGFDPMQFIQKFGSHLPGGGLGEAEDRIPPENYLRWQVAGKLEINCLSCHDAEPAHDQAQVAAQIAKQNFRWAAAASSGFAKVTGAAKDMPDFYDMYAAVPAAVSDKLPPTVAYEQSRFNSKNEVFLDIVRKIPPERCYFCHSMKISARERWQADEDVHLQAGMLCVDCHDNGLDHNMIRGEERADLSAHAASLTCAGCHLGDENEFANAGRFGAPRPLHRGIPTVHFEKMTCTACHSGAVPDAQIASIKTSRAHKLGVHGVLKNDEVLPRIFSPIFVKQDDGKIAPHNLLWPAFWAEVRADTLTPLRPARVQPFLTESYVADSTKAPGNWIALTDSLITAVLDTLAKLDSSSQFGYISGGRLAQLDASGELITVEHDAGKPYTWPLAHDVRPAAQSLGARGCDDCHSTGAPFYFSDVRLASPLAAMQGAAVTMTEFQETSSLYQGAFALSFLFRPGLKIVIALSTFIIFAVVVIYFFQGMAGLLKSFAKD